MIRLLPCVEYLNEGYEIITEYSSMVEADLTTAPLQMKARATLDVLLDVHINLILKNRTRRSGALLDSSTKMGW